MLQSSAITPVLDVSRRRWPVPGLIVTATTSGGAQTLATVPSPGVSYVERLTVTNTTGTAATLTLHMVPEGVTLGQVTEELDAFNVPANTTLRIDALLGMTYAPGTVCKVFSGTNGALTLRGAVVQEQ